MKSICSLLMLMSGSICFQLNAQPDIDWQNTVGGSSEDLVNFGTITKLSDGNYLIVGATASTDGDFAGTNNQGGGDAFLMKFDATGDILWVKTYGGSGDDVLNGVVENTDGSLLVGGFTNSNDGDVSGNHGGFDGWMITTDHEGNLLSQRCYGGSSGDFIRGMIITAPNTYVFAGVSRSVDGDVVGNHGGSDAWVAKMGNTGNLIWSKCFGGSGDEYVSGIVNAASGKIIIAGSTDSQDGIMSGNHGILDGFVIQLNQAGNIKWARCYGGSFVDASQYGFELSADGNVLLPMITNSDDGDVSGNHGSFDMLMLNVNSSNGNLLWSKCYGSTQDEAAFGVLPLSEGGFIALGATASNGDDLSTYDAQIVKADASGNAIWTKTFGGSDFDDAEKGIVLPDGSNLLLCHTASYDGEVTEQHGPLDMWLVKLDAESAPLQFISSTFVIDADINVFPNPSITNMTIDFPAKAIGSFVVVDLFNQIMYQGQVGQKVSLDVNTYPAGAYAIIWWQEAEIRRHLFSVMR